MAEAAAAAAIDRELTQRGAYTINIHSAGMGRNGIADRVAIYRGVPIIIEIKSPRGGRLRKLQRYELRRAAAAGATVLVARTRAEVRQALDDIDARLSTPTSEVPA